MVDQNQIDYVVREHVEKFFIDITEDFSKEETSQFKNGFKAGFNFAKRLSTAITET